MGGRNYKLYFRCFHIVQFDTVGFTIQMTVKGQNSDFCISIMVSPNSMLFVDGKVWLSIFSFFSFLNSLRNGPQFHQQVPELPHPQSSSERNMLILSIPSPLKSRFPIPSFFCFLTFSERNWVTVVTTNHWSRPKFIGKYLDVGNCRREIN